ncbi:MAG: hypothetical protein AAF212_06340 [Verrucomicrobiota bacterium]
MSSALTSVFDTFAGLINESVAERDQWSVSSESDLDKPCVAFYSKQKPFLRLLTGLAEGADAKAIDAFQECFRASTNIETQVAGVLPFGREDFLNSREPWFRDECQRLLDLCGHDILENDGVYDAEARSNREMLGGLQRGRAYAAQANILLRQCDILIAVADPVDSGKIGGTLETIQRAQEMGVPVLLIQLIPQSLAAEQTKNSEAAEHVEIHYIEPSDDTLAISWKAIDGQIASGEWKHKLRSYYRYQVHNEDATLRSTDVSMLVEMFISGKPESKGPSYSKVYALYEWAVLALELPVRFLSEPGFYIDREIIGKKWTEVKRPFRRIFEKSDPAETNDIFDKWREEIKAFNYHYQDKYRGAFVLNYGLIVLAPVFALCAATIKNFGSITLFGTFSLNLYPILLLAQFIFVGLAAYNVSVSAGGPKSSSWNKRFINYRFIRERLRSCALLAGSGILSEITLSKARVEAIGLRKNAMFWLFGAILRAHELAPIEDCKKSLVAAKNLAKEQRNHHLKTSVKYSRMRRVLKSLGVFFTMGALGLLLIILLMSFFDPSPHVVLLAFASLFPVVGNALASIRIISECGRLTERSKEFAAHMHNTVGSIEKLIEDIHEAPDLGSWKADAMFAVEGLAQDLMEEAADWSVVYDKELEDG